MSRSLRRKQLTLLLTQLQPVVSWIPVYVGLHWLPASYGSSRAVGAETSESGLDASASPDRERAITDFPT